MSTSRLIANSTPLAVLLAGTIGCSLQDEPVKVQEPAKSVRSESSRQESVLETRKVVPASYESRPEPARVEPARSYSNSSRSYSSSGASDYRSDSQDQDARIMADIERNRQLDEQRRLTDDMLRGSEELNRMTDELNRLSQPPVSVTPHFGPFWVR